MTAAGQSLLDVRALYCHYGKVAVLSDINMQVGPAEVVGLIGPNGSGKSTLLRCLGRLQAATTAHLTVCGRASKDYSRHALARTIAYVPQHVGPSMSLRVIDMVALGRFPYAGLCTAAGNRSIVLDAIERMHLQSLALRHFAELSGGERQRVLIARALAQQGQLLLLDEPTSDLDLRHQLATMAAVRAIATERRVGAVIAIHDLALAARFCDRMVMLQAGQVYAQGPWQSVLTPANLAAVYGVKAKVGADGDQPYIIPLEDTQHHAA